MKLSRRALLLAPLAVSACGERPPATPAGPPPVPLGLSPLSNLVQAPGLVWLVEASPRRFTQDEAILAAVAEVITEARFRGFARANGGIDLRSLEELVVARYRDTTLTLARGNLDPARVEASFVERATAIEGRAIDVPNPEVRRLFGNVRGERQQIAVFGREAVALEVGRLGPLKVAELFAQGKLKRSKPALHAEPLARASELLGPAEIRAFAPGPFEGEWAAALGGLLRASTGLGLAVRNAQKGTAKLAVTGVVLGAFDDDSDAAGKRLGAVVDLLSAKNALAHMLGLHQPVESPRIVALPDALRLEAVFDGARLARGLHNALDADIADIIK